MPNNHCPALSRLNQISLMAVPTISTPASTCSTIDDVRRRRASCGVPNSGRRVRSSVNTTGSAASPMSAPVTMRNTVPSVCEVSPESSHHRGKTKRK